MERTPAPRQHRHYELDVLRFIAAFAVLLFHYTFRGYAADFLNPVRYPELEGGTKYGYLGVELFFIISGYVVLLSAYGKSVRAFAVSRIVRLYPAYWVACTAAFVVTYLAGPASGSPHWSALLSVSVGQYVVNLTMVQKLLGVADIDGVYWTLAYEIQFYFFIAIVLVARWLPKLPWLMAGWLLVSVFAPMLPYKFTVLFITAYSPLFVAGMSFYLLRDGLAPRWQLYGLLLSSWWLAIHNALGYAQDQADYYKTDFSPVVIIGSISVFYLLFWGISTGRTYLRPRTWLYWAGALTYPLYLLHHNIGYVIYQHMGNAVNRYVLLAGVTLLMFGLACGLHVFVEKPLSQLLRRKLGPQTTPEAATSVIK